MRTNSNRSTNKADEPGLSIVNLNSFNDLKIQQKKRLYFMSISMIVLFYLSSSLLMFLWSCKWVCECIALRSVALTDKISILWGEAVNLKAAPSVGTHRTSRRRLHKTLTVQPSLLKSSTLTTHSLVQFCPDYTFVYFVWAFISVCALFIFKVSHFYPHYFEVTFSHKVH